jgi:hypothetical protein
MKTLALFLGGLMLAGCAGMDGKQSLLMDTSDVRPPPLPVADMPPPKTAPAPKPNITIRRQAAPPPLPVPAPRPAPVVEPPTPHHWYDHLKFWQK